VAKSGPSAIGLQASVTIVVHDAGRNPWSGRWSGKLSHDIEMRTEALTPSRSARRQWCHAARPIANRMTIARSRAAGRAETAAAAAPYMV
jgi:hypothetical protein